jgi:hypothetical protein
MRRGRQQVTVAILSLLFWAAPLLGRTSAAVSAHEVAASLAALGPRATAEARKRAAGALLAALRRAGLARVRAFPQGGLINVEGVLPGERPEEIVLSAHYDTVPQSPGAGDDASGCGLAIAAAADLRRTPLRHTVRVVFFDDEETGTRGSRAWLASLAPEARERILADLNLEMVGWRGSGGAVILSLPARHPATGEPKLAPGWLVHAVLRSGEAVEWPFAVADNRFPLLAQLVVRSARILYGSDSESFLKWDVPSVTLSDSSFLAEDPAYHRFTDVAARLDARRLEGWTQAVAAAVRRLDALAGRPLPEDRYLVLFGRVWLRRDLIWMGFLLWVLLVFRGRPGRWRGTSAVDRSRQMHAYLPGLLFRLLLLLAIFFAPVLAVLLLPAAALALVPPWPLWARTVWIVAGLLPALIFLLALGVAVGLAIASLDGGFQGGAPAAFLIPATLAAYVWTIARGPRRAPLTSDDASGKVES